MKVMVTGSRQWPRPQVIQERLQKLMDEEGHCQIIVGDAGGADTYCLIYGREIGHEVTVYHADWARHGRAAGVIRNSEMIRTTPDLVLAFWDGQSRGTKHAIEESKRRGLTVEVIRA